jgi:hypothetical protein
MTIHPAGFFYYSGRKSEVFPYTTKNDFYMAVLDDRIDYIVSDSYGPAKDIYVAPAAKKAPSAFIPVYKSKDGMAIIYRIERSKIPPAE